MTVNKQRIELLCQALESGEYEQCIGHIRSLEYTGTGVKWTYCAEGVAIDVALKNGLEEEEDLTSEMKKLTEFFLFSFGTLPAETAAWYGFDSIEPIIEIDNGAGHTETSIASANDKGTDFWTISQAIRAKYLKDEQ